MTVCRKWLTGGNQKNWYEFSVKAGTKAFDISKGSEEEFILEHYSGYTKVSDKKTFEYKVDHPRWQILSGGGFHHRC